VEGVRGVLASIGKEDRCFGQDCRGYHALAPIVDLVAVEAAFPKPKQIDFIGATETDGFVSSP
jgi:hypothetical protein